MDINRMKKLAGLTEDHADTSRFNDATMAAYHKLEAGEMAELIDASWSATEPAIGNFRDIGWAKKITTRDSMYWQWFGPAPIKISGKVVHPGGYTPEEDMDWS